MSLLDDARQMRDDPPLSEGIWCPYCERQIVKLGPSVGEFASETKPAQPHKTWCPMVSLPRIVNALESAKRLSEIVLREQWHNHDEDVRPLVDGSGTYSWCSSCDDSWPCNWSRALKQNQALVAALYGEGVTA